MGDTLARLKQALSDRYVVDRVVGAGGMATVCLAEDVRHRRRVAIKVLKPEVASALGKDRFLREIEIAAGLDHPHILPVFDSGEADGLLFYVMPYVEGESLRGRLDREKQLPIEDALQIAREVADALSYAHARDVVHRDIKPENILLAEGHARVADFGIARAIHAAEGDRLTKTGIAIGTAAYMSPEQATGDADIDGRSDLYSLGCVLYEMLAGVPPFTGPTLERIVHQHIAAEPGPITKLRPAVPPPVAAALMRALAKIPADRFNPAAQFADALRAPAPGPVTASPGLGSRGPLVAGVLFGVVAISVVVLLRALVNLVGLPDGFVLAGIGLLLAGLPVIVATSVIEQRRALFGTGPAAGLAGGLTWRRALMGGVAAFGLLALSAVAYAAMRSAGIGPAATLLSSGVLAERERVILADFENRTADPAHGATVTELMRVGLSQTPVVTVLDPIQVMRILEMMRRDPAGGVPTDVALEAAQREGVGVVLAGEVRSVGSQLAVTARLLAADGRVLTTQRETAAGEDDLLAAVDRLSSRLRERIGESLRSIRRTEALERVTTGSMPALRLYSQGMQAWNQGDVARGMQLFEEAITADSTFAMAHRKLAIILNNVAERRARAVEAATRAYEYRDRLTERERYTVAAAYHSVVTGNRDQVISAYRTLLDAYPDYYLALNNLGVIYGQLRDYERAAQYYERALTVDSTVRLHYSNLAYSLERLGQFDSAAVILDRYAKRFPGNPEVVVSDIIFAAMKKDYEAARHLGDSLIAAQRGTVYWEATAYEWLASLAAMRGEVRTAREQWRTAFDLTAERGVAGQYLERAARRAIVETFLTGDPAAGQRFLDDALRRFPLESLAPLDRSYGQLALAFAATRRPELAKKLLAEYDRTPEADHSIDAERWASGARGVIALVEERHGDALAELRRFDDGNACETCAYGWLARAWDQGGRADSARVYYEKLVETPSSGIWYDAAHLAHGYRRLGELFEADGRPDRAADYYTRFLELWESADPELEPQVASVRDRLARIAGEPRRDSR